jgi:hypothetical protein
MVESIRHRKRTSRKQLVNLMLIDFNFEIPPGARQLGRPSKLRSFVCVLVLLVQAANLAQAWFDIS